MAVVKGRVDKSHSMGATPALDGTAFRTWAPSAHGVAVVADERLVAAIGHLGWSPSKDDLLEALGDGSWSGFLPDANEGTPYLFFVIGEVDAGWKRDPYARELSLRPDYPASHCLVRSPETYPWHDAGWRPPAFSALVVYQLHVGTWWASGRDGKDVRATRGGTFLDVAARIQHLESLGVNAVQLLPIQEFETAHSLGYNGTDPFSPETAYCCTRDEVTWRLTGINTALARHGAAPLTEEQLLPGINQLKCLVDLLHLSGIGVIFDLVFNHAFGHDARGTFDDRSLWFYDRQRGPDPDRSLYFTDKAWIGPVFAYWNDWVCQYLIDNARTFVEDFHAYGLRYDEVSAIVNMGGDGGATFVQRLTATIRATRPAVFQIAEYWNWDRRRPVESPPAGLGFDVALADGLRDSVRDLLVQTRSGISAPLDLSRVASALDGIVEEPWRLNQCLENQDKTYAGHPDAARVPALADGSDHFSWYARSRSRAATAVLLTAPGIPSLFMGEEVLEDRNWNDAPQFGGLISWEGSDPCRDAAGRDFLRFTSDLIRLRREQPSLQNGSLRITRADGFERVIIMHRWTEGEGRDVVVIVSFDELPKHDYRVGLPSPGRWREAFNSDVYDEFPNPSPVGNGGSVEADGPAMDGFAFSAVLKLPANGALTLVRFPS